MNLKKEEFLKEFGNIYGYPNSPQNIDQIRDSEFNNRLQGVVYLDHAGATLYSESQLEAVFKDLTTNVYGNPHSQSNSSSNIDNIVDKTRQQVLDYCNASPKDYKCIFTSGATAAFKLIGESFPWSSQSNFMYTMENHNSVLGIREYALSQGAAAFAIDIDEAENNEGKIGDSAYVKVTRHPTQRRKEARCLEEETIGNTYNLFAFPSECNFSGVRFSLDLVKTVKENVESILEGPPACKGRWIVLVDAAKGCSTEPPDLSKYRADFVAISFYKLFGYPTGLGALLVHNEAAKLLKKTYFSGGTVAASIADIDFVKKRDGFEESFEDGTISFLSIASIRHGFKILNTLSCSAISSHTKLLSAYTRKILSSLRHDNGADVCTLYGKYQSKVPFDGLGSVVSFNLKRRDGSWFGYGEVEKLASLSAIKLRTGCFCNPGACAKYLGLSHLDLLSNIEAGHVCWDDYDIVHGKPTGAVRISFGYMSTFEDVKKFIEFVVTHFVSLPHKSGHADLSRERHIPIPTEDLEITSGRRFFLKSIFIYPIKSCAGFSIDSWPLSNTGLLYDREWLLKSPSGEILTQKKVPEMRLICTYIDLKTETMFVESPRCKTKLLVNLSLDAHNGGSEEINLLAHRYRVQGYTENINIWFSTAIGRPCSLLRCSYLDYFYITGNCENEGMCRDAEGRLNFVNEAQLLLVSEESIQDLNNKLRSRSSRGSAVQVNPTRFRPNLVISGGEPYVEDNWKNLKIGSNNFTSLGGCNRCQMINFDHQEGQVQTSNEPLLTLASYRRVKGKILFGILLRYDNGIQSEKDTDSWLHVGDEVQ